MKQAVDTELTGPRLPAAVVIRMMLPSAAVIFAQCLNRCNCGPPSVGHRIEGRRHNERR